MRRAVIGVLLVGSLAGLRAQAPTGFDARIDGGITFEDPRARPECHAADSLHEIAVQANVLYGFEDTRECRPTMFPEKPAGPQLTAGTAREAIDLLVAAMPGFEWKDRNGVAVVRPTIAWTDQHDVLNLPTAPFEAQNVSFGDAMHIVLHAVTPSLLASGHDNEQHRATMHKLTSTYVRSVKFSGGTLLDALDRFVSTGDPAYWLVGYRGEPKHGNVSIVTLKRPGGAVSAPITLPQG